MTGGIRVTARIEQHADGSRVREYEADGETYYSIDALKSSLETENVH